MTDAPKVTTEEARLRYPWLFDGVKPEPEPYVPGPPEPEPEVQQESKLDVLIRTVEKFNEAKSRKASELDTDKDEPPEERVETRDPEPTLETNGPGFIVCWSAQGGASRQAIETALAITGHTDIIDRFPSPPSSIVALQRAKASVQGHVKGVILRNMKAGEVAVISEKAISAEGKCDYEHGVSVSVPIIAQDWLNMNGFGSDVPADCGHAANEISRSYHEHKNRVEAADLSVWLTECIDAIGAVSVRPRGGVYFVPASQGAELMKIKACAEATSCVQMYIMALATDETTTRSIACATAQAFLGDFKEIEGDVAKWTAGLGESKRAKRGFNALGKQLSKLKDRVSMYRLVLATQESKLSAVIDGASEALQTTFGDYMDSKKGGES